MLVTPFFMVRVVRPSHFSKALVPMVCTPLGIVMDVSLGHLENA